MLAARIPAVHRNEDETGAGQAIKALHALMAVVQKHPHPVAFLQPQAEKGVAKAIDSLQQFLGGQSRILMNDGGMVRETNSRLGQKISNSHPKPPSSWMKQPQIMC